MAQTHLWSALEAVRESTCLLLRYLYGVLYMSQIKFNYCKMNQSERDQLQSKETVLVKQLNYLKQVVQDIEKEQQRLKVHIFNLKVGRRTSP
jgi:hypothetical protein